GRQRYDGLFSAREVQQGIEDRPMDLAADIRVLQDGVTEKQQVSAAPVTGTLILLYLFFQFRGDRHMSRLLRNQNKTVLAVTIPLVGRRMGELCPTFFLPCSSCGCMRTHVFHYG